MPRDLKDEVSSVTLLEIQLLCHVAVLRHL